MGLKEKYYYKRITGVITNGKNRGRSKSISYEESFSSVVTDKYKVGDKVFIKNDSIDGLKRDIYIAVLFFICANWVNNNESFSDKARWALDILCINW